MNTNVKEEDMPEDFLQMEISHAKKQLLRRI